MKYLRGIIALVGLMAGLLLPVSGAVAAERRQGNIPPGWKQVVWRGVVISYPKAYAFTEVRPSTPGVRAEVRIDEQPDPCQDPNVADCSPGSIRFRLYARNNLDIRSWAARNGNGIYQGFADGYTDTVIDGRHAVKRMDEAGVFGFWAVYAVPVGSDVLVIQPQTIDPRIVSLLRFSEPQPNRLLVGQTAMTKPARTWDLWSSASGSTRVNERPKLLGGSLVTILSITPRAVQVRTPEGVVGWIRAAAAEALTGRLELTGDAARFDREPWINVSVTLRNGIPLRAAPLSTARVLVPRIKAPERLQVQGVRGDWVYVHFNGSYGWARWYYDGSRYLVITD